MPLSNHDVNYFGFMTQVLIFLNFFIFKHSFFLLFQPKNNSMSSLVVNGGKIVFISIFVKRLKLNAKEHFISTTFFGNFTP